MIDSVSIFGYQIRPLLVTDVSDSYLKWLQDSEVIRFLEINRTNNDAKSINDLIAYVKGFENKDDFLFGIFDNNKHIGNLTINSINVHNGTFDMGYLIGDKNYWGLRAGEAALVAGLRFAFEELGLRKIFGGIYSKNRAARFLSKKIGFFEEAKLKDFAYIDGELDNSIIYTMTKEQWDELKKKYNFTY